MLKVTQLGSEAGIGIQAVLLQFRDKIDIQGAAWQKGCSSSLGSFYKAFIKLSFIKGAHPNHKGSTLMTSFPPNPTALGFNTGTLQGHRHADHSGAPHLTPF